MTKIAVAMLHGMGKQGKSASSDNMPALERALTARFAAILREKGHDPAGQLVVERVYVPSYLWGLLI